MRGNTNRRGGKEVGGKSGGCEGTFSEETIEVRNTGVHRP